MVFVFITMKSMNSACGGIPPIAGKEHEEINRIISSLDDNDGIQKFVRGKIWVNNQNLTPYACVF